MGTRRRCAEGSTGGFTWRSHARGQVGLALAALVAALGGCSSDGDGGSSLPPPPPVFTISGTVSGDVAEGVTVRTVGRAWSATTDASGRYTLANVTAGTYTLEASLDGYVFSPATRSVSVSGANVTGQDFTASLDLRVSGTVFGDAAEGVTVTLTGPSPATTTATATTDAAGRYEFSGVDPGVYLVTPSLAGGYTFSPANSVVTLSGASVSGPDFAAIASPHAILGRITGPASAGVLVALSGAAEGIAVTDGSGNFAFTGLADGAYALTPAHTGYLFYPETRDVSVSGANVRIADFGSGTPHRISGAIAGEAVANVTVTLSGAASAEATTDAAGRYEFAGLRDGSYVVTPALEGHAFTPGSRPVTLSGADVTLPDFTSGATGSAVAGTISGAVQAGVTVALVGAATVETVTDGAGAYAFSGVPDGTYLVIPALDGYVFGPASRVVVVSGADVAGQDFTASTHPDSPSILGTVFGDATAGVTVTLEGISPVVAPVTATTDAEGRFVFADLQDGLYLATPSLAGFTFFPANSLVTVDGLDVTGPDFEARAIPLAISGRVLDAGGAGVGGVEIGLDATPALSTTTLADGSFRFDGLPSGTYTLAPAPQAGWSFRPESLSVTLVGADAAGQDFLAIRTHAISGTVTGDVQAGVKVSLSGAATGEATTDAAGNYAFPELPDGDYVLTASLDGYVLSPPTLAVTLAGADVSGQDFVATTHVISGTVSGAIQAGVVVVFLGTATGTATTEADGTYSFTPAPDGSYMVIPTADHFAFDPASRTFRVDGADMAGQDFTSSVAP